MDGSEISLDLISGSETNVEQLIKQIYQVLIIIILVQNKNIKLYSK